AARARHEEIERLGCGDHEAWWAAHHRRALRAGRVAGAYRDADLGRVEAELGGDVRDLGEWPLEVLADVDGERLQRRDVHDPRADRDVDTAVVLPIEPVDRDQERGEGLARAGRGRDQ